MVLVLVISAFTAISGFTVGAGEELSEDHEDLGVYEIEPEDESVGVELGNDMEVTLHVNIIDGIGNDTNVVFYNATDGVKIGEAIDVGDGEWAEAIWEPLEYGETYEWYVNITDADNEANYTVSETWSFTTEHIPNMPGLVRPFDGYEDLEIYPDMETELNVSVRHPEGEMMNVTFHNATDDVEIGWELVEGEGHANATWEGLEYGKEYGWYVNVSEEDGDNHTVSETWSFKTEHIPWKIRDPNYPADGAENVSLDPELDVTAEHPEDEEMNLNVAFYGREIGEEFDELGDMTVKSGEDAIYTWDGRKYDTTYEWRVNVSEEDNGNWTLSEVWTFTTIEEEPPEELEPYFEVDITDYDKEVEEGKYITVEYTINNTGDGAGTQDIEFRIDGDVEETKEMTIEAGEGRSGKFFWEAEAGSHLLTVASEDDEDTVAVNVIIETEELPTGLLPIPGFTSLLLILASLFAVVIYHKKKQ